MNANEVLGIQDAIFILERHAKHWPCGPYIRKWTVWKPEAPWSRAGGSYDIKTYLSSHINNLYCIIRALVPDHFAKCIFDSGVVAVDEQAVHKLDGQRRLA